MNILTRLAFSIAAIVVLASCSGDEEASAKVESFDLPEGASIDSETNEITGFNNAQPAVDGFVACLQSAGFDVPEVVIGEDGLAVFPAPVEILELGQENDLASEDVVKALEPCNNEWAEYAYLSLIHI